MLMSDGPNFRHNRSCTRLPSLLCQEAELHSSFNYGCRSRGAGRKSCLRFPSMVSLEVILLFQGDPRLLITCLLHTRNKPRLGLNPGSKAACPSHRELLRPAEAQPPSPNSQQGGSPAACPDSSASGTKHLARSVSISRKRTNEASAAGSSSWLHRATAPTGLGRSGALCPAPGMPSTQDTAGEWLW